MKTTKLFLFLAMISLFCSCRSSRSMRKELLSIRSDLFYELSSPEYMEEVSKKVYLHFIDNSNLDYYSTIKKKATVIVPLLFFNYEGERFNVKLGEGSLTQTYREFLTEALLTECNSSTCFDLISNKKDEIPDSVYHLEVKILQNKTDSKIKLNESSLIWFGPSYIELPNHRVRQASTELSIAIRLSKGDDCLLDKSYTVNRKQSAPNRGYEDSYKANEVCLNTMTQCLSLATKEIVEDISQELHLLMSVQ